MHRIYKTGTRGDFNDEDVRCDPKPCSSNPNIDYIKGTNCVGTDSGLDCAYECQNGYQRGGDRLVSCLNGQWTNEQSATCVDVNDCLGNPCNNNGDVAATCTDNVASYSCTFIIIIFFIFLSSHRQQQQQQQVRVHQSTTEQIANNSTTIVLMVIQPCVDTVPVSTRIEM
jgi:hypothetical protein